MDNWVITGRHTMAELVGVTDGGLIKMEQRGLPILKKHHDGNEYHLKTVMAWLKADQERQLLQSSGSMSKGDLLLRRATADTRKAEIEVGKLEGSLGDIELIRRGLEGVMINQRTMLLSLPAQIGRDLDDPEIRVRIVAIVERRVREVLEALASYDPVIEPCADADGTSDEDDSDGVAPARAAPTTHRKSVGRAKAVSQPRWRGVRAVAQRDRAVPH